MPERPTAPQIVGADPEALGAQELVGALVERFGAGLVLASSFQKEETVLLDMLFAHQMRPDAGQIALVRVGEAFVQQV